MGQLITPPVSSYGGHQWRVQDVMGGAIATCSLCGLNATEREVTEGVPPCPVGQPRPPESPRTGDRDRITPESPIEFPCIAVPEGFQGTESEAVGLAVAGAFAALEKERDAALAEMSRMNADLATVVPILQELVTHFPETSWAHDAQALGRANEWLEVHKVNPEPST